MQKNNLNSNIFAPLRMSVLLAAVLMCIFVSSLIGCAGETRGTGGGAIGGRVFELDGVTAIPDVEVIDTESGESSITDANGNFSLPLQEDSDVVNLQFIDPEGAVSTGSVPVNEATSDVSVVVVINRETSQALITLETPTPTATSVGPTATASPAPTDVPGATATPVLPTVTPTATSTAAPTPRDCPSDFNNDGVVNQVDFDQFTALFSLGDPGADFDGNGFVNGDDYDAFLDAYAAGC